MAVSEDRTTLPESNPVRPSSTAVDVVVLGRVLDRLEAAMCADESGDDDLFDARGEEIIELARLMIDTPATSVEGVIAKLRQYALREPESDEFTTKFVYSALRDLQQTAGKAVLP